MKELKSKTMKQPEKILKSVFGYNYFRPLQKDIINNVLNKIDTLAIMPTGGGKSLCYQIPALIFEGITIVVSPLISLMQDQVSSLVENGVKAVYLNSSLEWDEYCDVVRQIKSGKIKIVYVSPEGLATDRMKSILQDCSVPIDCITVDEAHCVSEWGHDFRPDYMEIASLRECFPDAVFLALTATATDQVRKDIIKNLGMNKTSVFVASFNRENIYLEVKTKRNPLAQIVECLNMHPDESGIIYCFSRKQVDQLTESLANLGYSVLNYHAGLTDEERSDHQQKFIRDSVQIMVATVAFGMGINKPNVRFVIHYDMPKSLEEYYQEIGRAGRDGMASHALLLYNSGDIHKIRYFFDEVADEVKAEKLLQGMINYATNKTCRRRMLLSYFGESLPYENTTNVNDCCCDLCSDEPTKFVDVTVPAQKLMCCIIRTNQRFGTTYIIDVLLGSRQKRILENGHNMISTWGIGKELSKDDWFELTERMLEAGYIKKVGEYNVLELTSSGKGLLVTREKIELPVVFEEKKEIAKTVPIKAKAEFILHKKSNISMDDEECRIAEELKRWRKNKAEEENVPPYVIFGDKTISDIVAKKPQTETDLLSIYGIGSVKVEKFGSAILRIVKNLN